MLWSNRPQWRPLQSHEPRSLVDYKNQCGVDEAVRIMQYEHSRLQAVSKPSLSALKRTNWNAIYASLRVSTAITM